MNFAAGENLTRPLTIYPGSEEPCDYTICSAFGQRLPTSAEAVTSNSEPQEASGGLIRSHYDSD